MKCAASLLPLLLLAVPACDFESDSDFVADRVEPSDDFGTPGTLDLPPEFGPGRVLDSPMPQLGDVAFEIPADSGALFDFLSSGSYRVWPAGEPSAGSPGAHGLSQTFFKPTLVESLKRGAEAHPQGAGAVKELLNAEGDVTGWTVSVKLDSESAAGRGWFWYEVHSTESGEAPLVAETGAPLCVRCHLSGVDFVQAPAPE